MISTPSAARNATASRAPGRSSSARTTRPSGSRPLGRLLARRLWQRSASAGRGGEHAPPLLGAHVRDGAELAGRDSAGCAEIEARAGDAERAPAAVAREWDLSLERLRLRREGVGERLEGEVARRGAGRERAEACPQLVLVDAGSGEDLDDPQRRLGQRAGLVDAQRVDGGERLDRVELLRERAAPRHAHRRRRVGEADEQHQPLGNERHDPGRRGRDGRAQVHVAVVERVAEDRAEAEHQAHEAVQEPVDRALQRRTRVAEGARLAGEARGEAVDTDGGDLVGAGALDGERAGAHRFARRLAAPARTPR